MCHALYSLEHFPTHSLLRLTSADGTNRLTRERVQALIAVIDELATESKPLIIAGNSRFFSAGADLNEIAQLIGADVFEFARLGQRLMQTIDDFRALVIAAVEGYCMGGGLDLALACDLRIASANAVFGHRGAALGIMTGWGGTQRLPRLIGKSRALHMFLAAEKLRAEAALAIGLIDEVSDAPIESAINLLHVRQA